MENRRRRGGDDVSVMDALRLRDGAPYSFISLPGNAHANVTISGR